VSCGGWRLVQAVGVVWAERKVKGVEEDTGTEMKAYMRLNTCMLWSGDASESTYMLTDRRRARLKPLQADRRMMQGELRLNEGKGLRRI
jgi:hypothetical protein